MDEWDTAAVLKDPKRRLLLDLLGDGGRPMTRDELAALSGMARPTVAFHLERLTDAALLDVDFARPPGRSGPGAGRPAKRYRLSGREARASFPVRRYEIVATILARASAALAEDGDAARRDAAHGHGRELARRLSADGPVRASKARAVRVLDLIGYRPARAARASKRVVLRNCPFHEVARDAPEVVCPLNQRFVQGVLDELTGGEARAVLDGEGERCCVSATWPARRPVVSSGELDSLNPLP